MLYRYFDLGSVPKGQRLAAVRAQVSAWSPFAKSEYRVLQFPAGVGVFAWDGERMQARLDAEKSMQALRLSLEPESAFLEAPAETECVRLVTGIDGLEGQVWKQGHLHASRHWSQPPDEAEWLNFLRGASVPPSQTRDVASCLLTAVPWSAVPAVPIAKLGTMGDVSVRLERGLIFAVSLALMGASAVISRDLWDIAQRTDRLRAELVRQEAAASGMRRARDEALALRQQVVMLTQALSRPGPIETQDYLLTRLPQNGVEVQDLALTGSELRVVFKAPADSAREAIVKNLEDGGMFSNVHEAKDSPAGTISLLMSVQPRRAAGAPAAASKDVSPR